MRILVVDDNIINRVLLTEILRMMGHEFFQAENGKQAIEAVKKNDFDLVFLDIEMPVMNGIEATIYIRQKLSSPKNKIPVIALTAHNPQLFWEEYKDIGFNKILTKPYNKEKLSAIMNEIDTGSQVK